MKPVLFHLHSKEKHDWANQYYQFERIPVEGEYVCLSSEGDWYRVELVVHTPFSNQMCSEIYAVQIDRNEIMKEKVNNGEDR
ncbi:hypothetical protein [Sporolactobacillus laevolacticus]|uniref:Uncharacterized protein n=1 Tax=Sporolactobacillus laevolacticus DSM 442 TaxID=1395513 RepID=V6IZF7_9BACL|nr:hypothetical protein [Sporolactobacillus laevolacticus]EST12191.1 hypothetical protein P343_07695 [Sporolactobacillus laevolacticus DSM 442]